MGGALDAGLAGAAAGIAGQYVANQIFNPCTRGGTRKQNTNNRIFGGNTGNFLFGAIAGFAGHQLQTLLLEVHVEDKISYHDIICTISKTSLPIHFVLQAVSCNKQSSDTIVHILDSILYKFDFLTN